MQESHSNQDPVAALSARLAALERANGKLRAVVSALVLLAAAVVTVGATVSVPEMLAAKSFRLIDADGGERASLTAGDLGTAVLTLRGGDGGHAFTITLTPAAPFVVLADSAGKPLVSPEGTTPRQPAGEAPKRGGISWGKPSPAGDKEGADDSFDWAD